jgi:transposase
VHAILIRNLKARPPVTDLFGVQGRRWLAEQILPEDECETVAACLRNIDFLDGELALVDESLAEHALASTEMQRLMTLPGVSFVTAAALIAAIGDITRFPTARHLVAYLGLNPRVRQSGSEPARHGRISKQGPGEARHLLVEAAWHAARTTGPLRAPSPSGSRQSAAPTSPPSPSPASSWSLPGTCSAAARTTPSPGPRSCARRSDEPSCSPAPPAGRDTATRSASSRQPNNIGSKKSSPPQAETAYQRLVRDWQPTINKGAGVTRGRASSKPSKGKAARQTP